MPYQLQRRDVEFRNGAIRQGISQAIYEKMKDDPMVYTMGEGNHMKWRFDFKKVYEEFPDRIITWPIAEDSGINFALGASLLGVKPIFDVIVEDFLFRVMDSVCNTCATTWHVSGETIGPIIIRGETMLFAPSTGQRLEALFAHIPNLNVVVPSNQLDAYDLMKNALNRKEITVMMEDRMISDMVMKTEDKFPYPEGRHGTFIGQAIMRKYGEALTIVSYGLTLQRTESLLNEHPEWDVTLIDLTTLKPFDRTTVFLSAQRTGNLLFIEPDITVGGIGAEVVASVAEEASKYGMQVLVKRVGSPLRTISASPALHDYFIPNKQRITDAIMEMLS